MKKLNKNKNSKIAIILIAVVILGLVGFFAYNYFFPQKVEVPPEFTEGFGQTIQEKYRNPSQTFAIKFPTQPNIIDISFMGYPILNYYTAEIKTGDEFKVSNIKDVMSVLSITPQQLLENANQTLLGAIIKNSRYANEGQFVIIKNEVDDKGDRVLDAEILYPDSTEYALYRFVARENSLMVISVNGNKSKQKSYFKFINSFEWLKIENDDQGTIDFKKEEQVLSPEQVISPAVTHEPVIEN